MKGKNKCKILKEIRQRIADENDIPYVTRECTYQGECKGTCPKCEAELRYLEQELEKRRKLGKTVAIAAVAASLSMALTGCVKQGSPVSTQAGAQGTEATRVTVQTDPTETCLPLEGEPVETIAGEIDTMPPETTHFELAGAPLPEGNTEIQPETESEYELEGDVAILPDAETQP